MLRLSKQTLVPVMPTSISVLSKRVQLACAPLLLVLLMAAVLASGCTIGENPITGQRRVYGYSWEEEKKLGAQADEQIVQQFGVIDDEQLQQYVDRIGQRVLEESALRQPDTPAEFRETEFTFRVLDSPVVNAFALPGGYIYVTRGLMSHLNNEAQLAVVLGHEIVHVAARHASAQAGKQQLAQLGLIGAALGGEAAGLPGGNILRLGQTAAQLLFLEYSRDNEEESDDRGVEYAAKAGYAAAEGSEFFRSLKRIQEQTGQVLPTWLSTHPDPGNREQRIQELAQQWQEEGLEMAAVERDQYYGTIEGMVLGENPRHGFVEGGTFYHPDLRFQFPIPQGFQVDNQASQVIMVEQNQRAQLVFAQAPEGNSAQGAAQNYLSQLQQQEGVSVVDRGRTESDGIPASYVLLEAQTQQGTVRALMYFLEYGGNVWVFQGAASSEAFGNYEDVFLRTMRGFDDLTDRSILNVQPTRLGISAAQRTAPFRSFVDEGALPRDMDLQDLAIINQVELDEQIEQGRPLKLPR